MNNYRTTTKLYLSASLIILAAIISVVAINVLAIAQLYTVWRADAWYLYETYLDTGMPKYLFYKSLGHPVVFHKLLTASDWMLFNSTGRLLTGASVFFNTATAGILCYALWQSRRGAPPFLPAVLSGALLVGSVFWMTRVLEFTYPSQIGTTLVLAGTAMAAYCLYRHLLTQTARESGWPRDPWWWLMITSCMFASFSFSGGIASWVGVFMAMLILRVLPTRILLLCALGICTVVTTLLMPSHEEGSLLLWLIENRPTLREATEYFLVFMGLVFNFALFAHDNTRTGYPLFSGIVGLIGVVIFVAYSWFNFRRNSTAPETLAIPIALGWFAIAVSLLITLGRAGMEGGWSNPVQHRYPGWSIGLWIALLWISLYHLQPFLHSQAKARFGLIGLAGLCLMLYVSASYHGISYLLEYNRGYQQSMLAATIAPEIRTQDFRVIRPGQQQRPRMLSFTLPEMQRRGHGLFGESWTRRLGDPADDHYAIDQQKSCPGVWRELDSERKNGSRVYEGWATGPRGSFDTVLITADGKIIGGGKPTWLGDVRALGENTRVSVAHPRRYFLGMLFGHTPGWLAIGRLPETENASEAAIEIYGLINNNTACRIKPAFP